MFTQTPSSRPKFLSHARRSWFMRRPGSLILPRLELRSPQSLDGSAWTTLSAEFSGFDRDWLLRKQAQFAAQRGQYLLALASLDQLLARNPSSAADYNNRGLMHFQAGDRAAALADFNRAIKLNPQAANAFNNRANCYATQQDWPRAIADYQRAIALDPENIRAWLNQGITYRELQQWAQAIAHFDRALCLNQQTSDLTEHVLLAAHLYAERGRVHHLQGDWNCALADYDRALEFLRHKSQPTTYPPLWWQINRWRHGLLQPKLDDRMQGNPNEPGCS